MFYLTYRPKTIAELDNTLVKDTLLNILSSKTIPHAFLFAGQKGMGKTSAARILAKSVNCLNNAFAGKGNSVEPCTTCDNCKNIAAGHSPDVVEMDAASNRGIDEIRSLIREAAYAPMTSRYKVFIVDEAHMITNDAFNALLKTLEEPPAHVLFILATTNEEKIPRTIISRCTRVNFGKARISDIVEMLKRISKNEKITVNEDLLLFIAESSDYSFRDATKLLEELVIQKKLTVEEAQAHVGTRSKKAFLDILESGTVEQAVAWIHEFSSGGGSSKVLIEELLHTFEELLLMKTGVEKDVIKSKLTVKEIATMMKQLSEAYGMLRISPVDSIPLEIAVVEFYNLRK